MENQQKHGNLNFSIDSSLLFQLGEHLVAKPSIALAELVKNAYDADATEVKVTLENVGATGGTVLIEDNGHGMTFEEVQKRWMRIATNNKLSKLHSRIFCRPLTGAKGIGRFAARRLGNHLTLQSIAENSGGGKELIVVDFGWENSFEPGTNLTEIPVSYSRTQLPPSAKTGVSLLIDGVRDIWTKEDIVTLQRDLLSLQTPFPDLVVKSISTTTKDCLPDPGFNFILAIEGKQDSEELKQLSGGLGDAFLGAAWARLDGKVRDDGKAQYNLEIIASSEYEELLDDDSSYTGLKKAQFRVYFMVYKSEHFEQSDFGVREAQRKGRAEGGVKLYLDGFRVFPYGDPGDDWLRLDQYAASNTDIARIISPSRSILGLMDSIPGRPYLLIPRNNQLFGVVSLSQTLHDVDVNISREQLIESFTVEQLRRFIQNGIYWMTLKYAAHVAEQRGSSISRKPRSVVQILTETQETVARQDTISHNEQTEILEGLEQAIQQARVAEEQRISEISLLRVLASAGTTLALMNHQLQALMGGVSQIEQDLGRLRPSIPMAFYERYDDIRDQVIQWRNMVEQQVSQLGFLLSPDSRQRRQRLALYEVVENVRRPMGYYMQKYGVKFYNNVAPNLRTPAIFHSELYAVLINLLSNALKAVHGQPVREVAVEAFNRGATLVLQMKDTGVGLDPKLREKAFRPFETTSIPNPVLGIGTGLGLKVVRDILEVYGGSAQFVDVQSPWVTGIEVVLPKGT